MILAKIIEAAGNGLTPLQLLPPTGSAEEVELDHEDHEALGGIDGALPAYTPEQIARMRKELAATRAKLTKAQNSGNKEEADRLQETIAEVTEYLNGNTRPGGKSVLAVRPLENVKRRIRSAVAIVCNKLGDEKHSRPDIAEHIHACFKFGDDNRYMDLLRTWTIKY